MISIRNDHLTAWNIFNTSAETLWFDAARILYRKREIVFPMGRRESCIDQPVQSRKHQNLDEARYKPAPSSGAHNYSLGGAACSANSSWADMLRNYIGMGFDTSHRDTHTHTHICTLAACWKTLSIHLQPLLPGVVCVCVCVCVATFQWDQYHSGWRTNIAVIHQSITPLPRCPLRDTMSRVLWCEPGPDRALWMSVE